MVTIEHQPIEDVLTTPEGITLKGAPEHGSHVRKRGGDVSAGDLFSLPEC